MTANYNEHVSTKATPQKERTPGRIDEVANSEGGFVFDVDDWTRLNRFLILGSEGGSFYAGERELTKDNAEAVIRLIKSDGLRVVNVAVAISDAGRAVSNDPALFVLALAAKLGDEKTRQHALNVMPSVARIGTHLFTFAQYLQSFGGWGRATKRAFQRWYNQKTADQLAVQLLKYRQRNGWSHRDILRLTHPVTDSLLHRAMYDVTTHPDKLTADKATNEELPRLYTGFYAANSPIVDIALTSARKAALIREYKLSREMIPTDWLKEIPVWEALLDDMKYTALIRNLGVMTANGTLKPLGSNTQKVIDKIKDGETLKKSRTHPLTILVAQKTYESGHGFKGSLSWTPDKRIVDALGEAFYRAFDNVEPTGKRFMIGVDVSGSMSSQIAGKNISAAEGAAALAMVTARTEEKCYVHGFSAGAGTSGHAFSLHSHYYSTRGKQDGSGFVDLKISPKDSLPDILRKTSGHNFGATDCSVPMIYALKNGIEADTFIVLTDSETWAGDIKPVQALAQYRKKTGIPAKLVVVGMVANQFTIADPNDAGMLDVVGFDAAIPQVIADFVSN